jgi:hypothetical protein
VAGLWAVGAVATVCAVAAYAILGSVLAAAGLPAQIALCPAAYAVFALAALFNPLYAALLPVLLPVSAVPHPGQQGLICIRFSNRKADSVLLAHKNGRLSLEIYLVKNASRY